MTYLRAASELLRRLSRRAQLSQVRASVGAALAARANSSEARCTTAVACRRMKNTTERMQHNREDAETQGCSQLKLKSSSYGYGQGEQL